MEIEKDNNLSQAQNALNQDGVDYSAYSETSKETETSTDSKSQENSETVGSKEEKSLLDDKDAEEDVSKNLKKEDDLTVDDSQTVSSLYADNNSNDRNALDDAFDKALDDIDSKMSDVFDKITETAQVAGGDVSAVVNDNDKGLEPKEEVQDFDINQQARTELKDLELENYIEPEKEVSPERVDDLKEFGDAYQEEKAKLGSLDITDEMRNDQAKTEDVVNDAMQNFNNAGDDLAQDNKDIADARAESNSIKEEVIEDYTKDKLADYAQNSLGIEDEKTKEAFVDYTYEQNKEAFQNASSDMALDNEITKAEVFAKDNFENHLEQKESALNDLKDDKTVDQDLLKNELNDVKDMKSSLSSDKEQGFESEDKSSESNKDAERREDFDSSIDVPEKEQNQGQEQGMSR